MQRAHRHRECAGTRRQSHIRQVVPWLSLLSTRTPSVLRMVYSNAFVCELGSWLQCQSQPRDKEVSPRQAYTSDLPVEANKVHSDHDYPSRRPRAPPRLGWLSRPALAAWACQAHAPWLMHATLHTARCPARLQREVCCGPGSRGIGPSATALLGAVLEGPGGWQPW